MGNDKDLPEDVDDIIKRYQSGAIERSLTFSSTATNVFSVLAKNGTVNAFTLVASVTNTDDLKAQLMSVKKDGYEFDPDSAQVACSLHQNRLRNAKKVLISDILPFVRPTPDIITDVIDNCGRALCRQIDIDRRIFTQCANSGINSKLAVLGLSGNSTKRLYDKYCDLNKYYNASKHEDDSRMRRAVEKLNSDDGKFICIDFFETVRRIFKWYYRKYAGGIPDWDELATIRYSDYCVQYTFRYDRRFPLS